MLNNVKDFGACGNGIADDRIAISRLRLQNPILLTEPASSSRSEVVRPVFP